MPALAGQLTQGRVAAHSFGHCNCLSRVFVVSSSQLSSRGKQLDRASKHFRRHPRVETPTICKAQAARFKPAYNKYRSRSDIEADYVKEWRDIANLGNTQRPLSVWSALLFVPVWINYTLLPEELRFFGFCVKAAFMAVAYAAHKRLVIQGARLDSWLAGAGGQTHNSFSRTMALRRFHGRVGVLDNLRYRWHLLRGETVKAPQIVS